MPIPWATLCGGAVPPQLGAMSTTAGQALSWTLLRRWTKLAWAGSQIRRRLGGVGAGAWRHAGSASSRPRLSISYGPEEPPLLTQTIPEHFASVVSHFGDQPAVICRSASTTPAAFSQPPPIGIPISKETVFTYETLDLVSNSLAHSLRSLGVKKGDRVAVSLGNCPEFAALTYAVFKLGAVLVPLNPGFNAAQVAAALNHLQVELLVVGAVTDLAYKPCRGRPNLPLIEALVPNLEAAELESEAVPSLRKVVVVDNTASHPGVAQLPLPAHRALTPFTALHDLASTPASSTRRAVVPDAPLDPAETINVQFTSGTTSHPKAAMLTHRGILNNGALIAGRMGLVGGRDRIVCPPPLFHCFGAVLGYMATATSGAAIIFPSPAFDPAASLLAAAEHRATAIYGVATMFVAMLEALGGGGLLTATQAAALPSHLRTGIAAGSSVPEALMTRLFASLGVPELVICYGQTETSPVSTMTAPGDPLGKRTATVGRVMPHTAVKVVDPLDRSKVLPVGERGEVAASGYLVMRGYWGEEALTREVRVWEPDDPAATASSSSAGEQGVEIGGDGARRQGRVWLYSGDEGRMDEDGYLAITGRIKDLIIRGGENIHPLEVENCLLGHPLIADASVVGVPDHRLGECVAAFVIVHDGVRTTSDVGDGGGRAVVDAEGAGGDRMLSREEARAWVRERLSAHLVPRHVFWVSEFPKTASGKVQKFKLRELAVRLLRVESGMEED